MYIRRIVVSSMLTYHYNIDREIIHSLLNSSTASSVYPFVVRGCYSDYAKNTYNKSVQYHGHKYIKLEKQNKKNERRGTRRGKEWEPEMGHGWKWKHRGGTKKGGQEAAEDRLVTSLVRY